MGWYQVSSVNLTTTPPPWRARARSHHTDFTIMAADKSLRLHLKAGEEHP
ncbi:MAG: hypothetical protein ACLTZB_04140 [Streptococcus salivarius]